jgi:hypothetical protein
MRRDPLFICADFPPLSGAKVGSRNCGSPEFSAFKLQVGSWSFEVSSSPSPPVAPSASLTAAPDLEGFLSAEERGNVDACCPHSSEWVRDPSISGSVQSGAVEGAQPSLTQRSPKAQMAKPVNGPARLGLLFSRIRKWAWRPVETLDPSFTFSASIQICSVLVSLPSTLTFFFFLRQLTRLSWIAVEGTTGIAGRAVRTSKDLTRKPYR